VLAGQLLLRPLIDAAGRVIPTLALIAATCSVARAAPPFQDLARRTVGADQGVYAVAEDGTLLAAIEADRPVAAASVAKVATTLALLDALGPNHVFRTRLEAAGPVAGNEVDGDLVVRSENDPFLVFESALLMMAELRSLGVERVRGSLRVEGPLIYNWKPDPHGTELRRTLSGNDGSQAWPAVVARRPELRSVRPQELRLVFAGMPGQKVASGRQTLVSYGSPPLVTLLKTFNGYSNNVFHQFSETIGGPAAVERLARERVEPELRSAIIVENAAGGGTKNRLSPRAAAALVRALAAEASEHRLGLADLLPVSGIDPGTLKERFDDAQTRGVIVGKTGTYGSIGACALAGVLRTKRYGEVTFAILNRGVAVPAARARQDAFVRGLIENAGGVALAYRPRTDVPLLEATIERPH
jgi:D-alanyl-D-alanine carboxypeptidase/D-alanyl-D-alanine-endopeptidase (penicillin-binding protein 4)